MNAREMLRCAGISRFVDTYIDGEFGEGDRAEFEVHITGCEECRQKVRTHAAWKAAIKSAAPRELAPAALRTRLVHQIRYETARQSDQLSWRRWAVRAMPVAAAVGMVATLILAPVQWSPVAADVVAKHQRNLPLEVSGGSEQVKQWYLGKVDFPVHVPEFHDEAVSLVGGRLASIGDKQAAYLVYKVHGDKVSVFMFDAADLPIAAKQKTVVGNREVYLDQAHGYNVALFRDRGVGYAIASDLDQNQIMQLVSATVSR